MSFAFIPSIFGHSRIDEEWRRTQVLSETGHIDEENTRVNKAVSQIPTEYRLAVTDALIADQVQNNSVIIVRYEGPKGGPGMPELLAVTMTLVMKQKLDKVALITDGRFSGYTSGPCIGHVSPEAYVGGPIGIVKDGDLINIDILQFNRLLI